MRRSRHQRNAVSVLPVPVGARISVLSPRAIAGQPSRCGAVGCSKTARNQAAVTGWNSARTSSGGAAAAGRVCFLAAMGAALRIAVRGLRLYRCFHGPQILRAFLGAAIKSGCGGFCPVLFGPGTLSRTGGTPSSSTNSSAHNTTFSVLTTEPGCSPKKLMVKVRISHSSQQKA